MRRLGHNWPKYSDDGGTTSWHGRHLRGMAALRAHTTVPAVAR